LHSFRLFAPLLQLARVLKYGTYLAQYAGQKGRVNLYHLANEGRGYFIEVRYNEVTQEAEVGRSFASSGPLAEYVRSHAQTIVLHGEAGSLQGLLVPHPYLRRAVLDGVAKWIINDAAQVSWGKGHDQFGRYLHCKLRARCRDGRG